MEHIVIIVNGWKLLTIITERSILDVAAVLIRLWFSSSDASKVRSAWYNLKRTSKEGAFLSFKHFASIFREQHSFKTTSRFLLLKDNFYQTKMKISVTAYKRCFQTKKITYNAVFSP